MKKANYYFLALLALAVIISTIGCAAKQKPDLDKDAIPDAKIQDQDLSFDEQGSDSGRIDGLRSIHFAYNKSSLDNENKEVLTKDANWLAEHPREMLQIEGHCDRMGSTEYNLGLGQRRAESVKHFLTALGVKGARLSTISYGKERLLDSAETPEADAKNRRANFKLIGNTNMNQATN